MFILRKLNGDGLPEYKVVCYFSSWSHSRKGRGKFEISNIDANLCTHIIYVYATHRDNQIVDREHFRDLEGLGNLDGYKHFNDLKLKNPKLKTLISIWGSAESFSRMASDVGNRTRFVESVAPFLQKRSTHGLEIKWVNGGNPEDKRNFVILLQELKTNLKAQGLLLTAAVPEEKLVIDRGYDILALSKELDFINLNTYIGYTWILQEGNWNANSSF
ncbi:hypothetical protein JTE90_006941 [Oedothorax gibbosus]|uniref:GH18 domain-containing protein n=1 Tax=Oedothorax gibbosus TaxID=931172 RepID=A0AAV6TSY7_9ARAC|nr:hypothetical protein JTE90_006941 [Oedothorax gibbosus]